MNKKQKTKITLWIIGLAILLTPVYFLVWSHDLYLWQLSRSLAAVNHLPYTKRIASAKDLGLLVGNGNHCDYFVAELRSYNSDLSLKKIKTFYKNTKIWNPLNRRNERVSVGFIEKGRIKSDEEWIGAPDFLKGYFKSHLPQQLGNQKLYFVLFLDVGNAVGCDIRCL